MNFSGISQSGFATLRHTEREPVDGKAPLKNTSAGQLVGYGKEVRLVGWKVSTFPELTRSAASGMPTLVENG